MATLHVRVDVPGVEATDLERAAVIYVSALKDVMRELAAQDRMRGGDLVSGSAGASYEFWSED